MLGWFLPKFICPSTLKIPIAKGKSHWRELVPNSWAIPLKMPNIEKQILQDSKEARDALEIRLKDAATFDPAAASPQSAALLAIYAISAKKWDDARRLVYQGCLTWNPFGSVRRRDMPVKRPFLYTLCLFNIVMENGP